MNPAHNSTDPRLQNNPEFWKDNDALDELLKSKNLNDYEARTKDLEREWAHASDKKPLYVLERRIAEYISATDWAPDKRPRSRQLAAAITLAVLRNQDVPRMLRSTLNGGWRLSCMTIMRTSPFRD